MRVINDRGLSILSASTTRSQTKSVARHWVAAMALLIFLLETTVPANSYPIMSSFLFDLNTANNYSSWHRCSDLNLSSLRIGCLAIISINGRRQSPCEPQTGTSSLRSKNSHMKKLKSINFRPQIAAG